MLNLGGLFFTLDADTRGLQTAQRRVENFANQVRQAFQGVSRGTVAPQFANQLARQERQVVGMLERIKKLQNQVGRMGSDGKWQNGIAGLSGKRLEEARRNLELLSHQYDVFTRKMASGSPVNALDFGRRIQHMKSQIDDATRSINTLTKAQREATTAWGNATGTLHSLGSAALVVQGHFGGLSTRLFFFSNLVRETNFLTASLYSGLAGMASGIALVGTSALTAGKQLQQINMALTSVTGNSAVTAIELGFVRDVAEKAGIAFEDAAKGYTRFAASANGVISLKQTHEVFLGISMAAAKMQLSVEDTQGVFRALDQMMSKGTVQAEELRGQLGDRLPGAFKIAAAAMGVTTRQLGEMMKKGQVVSAEFVPKFVETLERMYNIDTSKNIESLTASLGRLSNQWTYFGQALDQSTGATRKAQQAVDLLAGALASITGNLPAILSGIGALTGAVIGLGSAMLFQGIVSYVMNLWNLVAVYNTATRSVMLLATGMNVLNAAMTRFPAAKLLGLLANLIVTIGSAVVGYKMMQNAVEANNESLADIRGINQYIAAQKAMGFQVRETTAAMIQQLQAQIATQRTKTLAAADAVKASGNTYQNFVSSTRGSLRGQAEAGFAMGQAKKQYQEDLNNVRQATSTLKGMTGALRGLSQVIRLPEVSIPKTSNVADGGGDDKGKTPKEKLSETAKAYERLVEDIAKSANRAASLQAQIQYILGGGNQEGLSGFRALEDAKNALSEIDPATQEGIEALGKIRDRLIKAGVAFKDTGKLVEDVTIALAGFYDGIDRSEEALRVWVQLGETMRKLSNELTDIQVATNSFAKSGLFGAWIGEEAERALERGRKVEEFRRTLILLGQDQATVNNETAKYLDMLRKMDEARVAYDKIRKAAEATREAMRDGIRGFSENLRDVITGVKSLGDALRDLAMSMVNNLWERFITTPLLNLLDTVGQKKGKKETSGVDVLAAGLGAANDNAAKMAQLGIATATATTSLTAFNQAVITATASMATMGGGGGGGGSGLLGKILNIGKSVTKDLLSNAPGRAMGGSMAAGNLYQINEPGVSGEYFIPSVNGYMSRNAPSNDRGGGVFIDASTTIDARGADATAVARLRQEMAARDAQLRKELPFLIDGRVKDSSGRRRFG